MIRMIDRTTKLIAFALLALVFAASISSAQHTASRVTRARFETACCALATIPTSQFNALLAAWHAEMERGETWIDATLAL